jgi:hypothetical protein
MTMAAVNSCSTLGPSPRPKSVCRHPKVKLYLLAIVDENMRKINEDVFESASTVSTGYFRREYHESHTYASNMRSNILGCQEFQEKLRLPLRHLGTLRLDKRPSGRPFLSAGGAEKTW